MIEEAIPIAPVHDGLRPGRLWSLRQIMRTFYTAGFFSVADSIARWCVQVPETREEALEAGYKASQLDALSSYDRTLVSLGLPATLKSLERILEVLRKPTCTFGELAPLSQEFMGRLIDETDGKTFFALTPRESAHYEIPRRGWEKAVERFPEIIDDVEEASKCLAFSRYPSAIFHSVQIVEIVLIDLGKFLKVTDPISGWTAVSGALSKSVRKEWKTKTQFEKKNHAFLEQVQGTVEGLKNAWRNKISHADGRLILLSKEFSEEIAEEILMATRAFARRLAEGLPPKKPRKDAS